MGMRIADTSGAPSGFTPAAHAAGVNPEAPTDGTWFAGALLTARQCGGDCSHESFIFDRVQEVPDWKKPQEDGRYFEFCKTAYKPYDIAVTAALIVVKHYCPEVSIHSDGSNEDWEDARMLCVLELGYGSDFRLDEDEEE